jgi:hypothetical protein
MEKARDVEKAFEKRFLYPEERLSNNRSLYIVSSDKLKQFAISYCKVMNYGHKVLSDEKLKLYADSV